MKRRLQLAALSIGVLGILVLGFALGFRSHRDHSFPYGVLAPLLGNGPSKADYTWMVSPSRPPDTLRALGYVNSTLDSESELTGVVAHDANAAWPGWNLFHSAGSHTVQLRSMTGQIGYSWEVDFAVAHAELLDDASLLIVDKDQAIGRYDASGEQVWRYEAPVHHAPWVHDNVAYALTRYTHLEPRVHPGISVLDERVTLLDLDSGAVIEEFSLLELILDSPYAFLLPSTLDRNLGPEDGPLDLLHINQVVVLDGSLAPSNEIYAAGNLLISARHLNAVFIIDGRTREIVWIWGPSNLMQQHHPTLLETGNVLLFDNRVVTSRVLEVDPITRQVTWSWTEDGFFSPTRGSVQRLPNGNTLISESDSGYVVEIDTSGVVVWRFANPDVDARGFRSAIWRMTRFPDSHPAIQAIRAFRDIGAVAD